MYLFVALLFLAIFLLVFLLLSYLIFLPVLFPFFNATGQFFVFYSSLFLGVYFFLRDYYRSEKFVRLRKKVIKYKRRVVSYSNKISDLNKESKNPYMLHKKEIDYKRRIIAYANRISRIEVIQSKMCDSDKF